jgi:hypothetical protein
MHAQDVCATQSWAMPGRQQEISFAEMREGGN